MSSTAVPVSNSGNGYTIVTHVISPQTSTQPGQVISTGGPLQKFLKGEPKALGERHIIVTQSGSTVQIMIGLLTFMFGIVISIHSEPIITTYSGIAFWGSLMYIVTGSLAVGASNNLHHCVVKGTLVMNVLSTITAATAIILLSIDCVITPYRPCNYYYDGMVQCERPRSIGIIAVLLVFSILQFVVSISVSAFACKATCRPEPSVNITVVPDRVGCCSVVNPFPAHNNLQYPAYPLNTATATSPPMESPPEYTEIKGHPDH